MFISVIDQLYVTGAEVISTNPQHPYLKGQHFFPLVTDSHYIKAWDTQLLLLLLYQERDLYIRTIDS